MVELMKTYLRVFVALFVTSLSVSTNADTLRIEIIPHKRVFMSNEPVLISATVTNIGSAACSLMQHNAPTLHQKLAFVDLVFGANKEKLSHWSSGMGVLRRTEPYSLARGDSITVDLVMLYNAEKGFFGDAPGQYWIAGRVVVIEDDEIITTPIAIGVREPPRAERAVWDWLNEHKDEYGRLVQVPWEAKLSDEFVAECDRICTQTNSLYGEYLAYFLSRWYREGPNKDAAKSQRFAEIAKAKASSEKLRTEAEKLLPDKQPGSTP